MLLGEPYARGAAPCALMISYKDLSIITDKEVYPPTEDSYLAAEVIEDEIKRMGHEGMSVLDMGTATGILGLVAASNKSVGRVTMADINKDAVRICKENVAFNAERLHAQCSVVESDFFSNVSGRFDIITFNAPYLRTEEGDEKLGGIGKAVSGGPSGMEVPSEFLRQAPQHLNKSGRIILVVSSFGDLERLGREIRNNGFSKEREKKVHVFFEDIIVMVLAGREDLVRE